MGWRATPGKGRHGRVVTALAAAVLVVMVGPVPGAAAKPGGLDRPFGTSGFTVTDFGARTALGAPAAAIQRQADGRLVVAGSVDGRLTTARYLADGRLDPSFGQGGVVSLPLAGVFTAIDIALAPSGRVLVAGYDESGLVIAAFTAAGQSDTGFGPGGVARFPALSMLPAAIALRLDGSVVVAGNGGGPPFRRPRIIRLLPSGALDPNFGIGGVAPLDALGDANLWDVVLDGDKIVVVGAVLPTGGADAIILRLLPGGTLDPSFGSGGISRPGFPEDDTATSLAIDGDGRYVVGTGANAGRRILRFLPAGALDTTFGVSGGAAVPDGFYPLDLAVQPDRSVVSAGAFIGGNSGYEEALVMRHRPDGSLDAAFGCGGGAWFHLGDVRNYVSGVAVGPEGIAFSAVRASGFESEFPKWIVGRLSTAPPVGAGYRMLTSLGVTEAFGDAAPCQSAVSFQHAPAVAVAGTPGGRGQWIASVDGGVFALGDAGFFGSMGGRRLARPIVGMAATPSGRGYWLVASDGGVFAFGDARFFGSTGAIRLNKPIVGMAATPSGRGYWLVASDGGVFAFGDAAFLGSTGAIRLNKPVVGMAVPPAGGGYWLVASDGGVFAFGAAPFSGSTGGIVLQQPVVGMAAAPAGGYWLVGGDGGVFAFGGAPFLGSLGNRPAPVIAVSST